MGGIDKFGDHPITADRIHHEIEAGRLAYRDRGAVLADPTFSDVPVSEMLGTAYADLLRGQIMPDKRIDLLPASTLPRHASTVYITVVDRDRNACSLIITLELGSGIMAPESGVMLHNRGMGFVVDPDHPNGMPSASVPCTPSSWYGHKNGRTTMSFGVMGGEYQAFGHMHPTRHFDFDMDVQMAPDTPRFARTRLRMLSSWRNPLVRISVTHLQRVAIIYALPAGRSGVARPSPLTGKPACQPIRPAQRRVRLGILS